MAVTYLAHAIANGVSGATTGSIDTSGADFLVLSVSDYDDGPGVTVSDSKSNTWTPLTAYYQTTGNMRIQIYYAWNATVGSGHTFTSGGSGVYTCIAAAAFGGLDTSSDPHNGDVTGVSDFTTFLSNPMFPGSVTVAAGDLAITVAGMPFGVGTTVFTIDSGFTITDQFHSSGVTEGAALAYFINSGASTAKNPGWDPDIGSFAGAASIATFAASGVSDQALTLSAIALAPEVFAPMVLLDGQTYEVLRTASTWRTRRQ